MIHRRSFLSIAYLDISHRYRRYIQALQGSDFVLGGTLRSTLKQPILTTMLSRTCTLHGSNVEE